MWRKFLRLDEDGYYRVTKSTVFAIPAEFVSAGIAEIRRNTVTCCGIFRVEVPELEITGRLKVPNQITSQFTTMKEVDGECRFFMEPGDHLLYSKFVSGAKNINLFLDSLVRGIPLPYADILKMYLQVQIQNEKFLNFPLSLAGAFFSRLAVDSSQKQLRLSLKDVETKDYRMMSILDVPKTTGVFPAVSFQNPQNATTLAIKMSLEDSTPAPAGIPEKMFFNT